MSEILALGWTLSGEKLYCFITVPNGLNNRGSSLLWAFRAVVPSVSGPLWPGFELVEIVTSTHCFSSGNLVELEDIRECMSQVVMVETLQCRMCLELLLGNIYYMILCHFGPIIYLEYTNLVVVYTVDSVWYMWTSQVALVVKTMSGGMRHHSQYLTYLEQLLKTMNLWLLWTQVRKMHCSSVVHRSYIFWFPSHWKFLRFIPRQHSHNAFKCY